MNRVIRHLRRTAITTTTTRSSNKCHASLVMEATNARCSSQVVNNTHFNINTHQINRSFSTQQHYGNVNMGSIMPFNLADIGEGIKEVEIVSWNVKEGDKINEFDLVAEVKSDKANVEITSRYSGVIKKLHYGVGDTALVGEPLIDIEVEGNVAAESHAAPSPSSQQQPSQSQQQQQAKSVTDSIVEQSINKVLTAPAVRRIAREHNIDLTMVKSTGPKGRLLKEDVLNYIKGGAKPVSAAPAAAAPVSAVAAAAQQAPLVGDRVEPVKGIKKAMIKTMNAANAIPHFGLTDDIRMDKLMQMRGEVKRHAEEQDVKLTFMPFFIKAISLSLKQYPILNSQLSADETQITYRAAHNIGIAMDTPEGLLVPVIKNVQNLSIMDIARELNRLQALGAKGKLGQNDLTGGTFSLSNIGTIGGKYASPLLPPGNVGIGAIGKIQKVPVFDDHGNVIPAQIMNISWSADHRIIDGATLARFSRAWKNYLEHPSSMFLEMQ